MADIISRLKLQSGEFDSKIKRATQGLLQMEQECRKVGGSLAILKKDQKEYVQSLGRMQTVSTSVRGKISELSNAYTELRAQYNRLSNEEKNGDFGKALSSSLDQLKTRISDSKKELSDINQELGNTKNAGAGVSSFFDELGSKMGVNITQLTKFGGVLAAAGAAVKVLKDAFFQSEANIDEWGRTMKGAEGAYDVFLQTLNNGDWSNFFENLSTAVRGARDLYDSLDRLGSIKANNQAAIAIVQQQIAQLRLLKQQGKNVDDQLKAATDRLAQLQGQSVAAGKSAGKQTIEQTIRNGLNSMGGAQVNDKTIRAAIGGILTNGQREFDRYANTVSKYENWSHAQRTTTRRVMDSQGGETTIYSKKFDINLLSAEQQRQYKIAKVITERETEIQKGIELYANAVQEGTSAAREEFKGNRYALAGSTKKSGSGTKTKTPSEQASEKYEQAQKDYNQALAQAALEVKAGMISEQDAKKKELSAAESLWKSIGDAREVYDSPKLKEAQEKVEKTIIELGQSIKAASVTWETGLSGFNAQTMQAWMTGRQSDLSKAEIGSSEYSGIMSNIADMNTIKTILEQSMKAGIDSAQFNLEPLWEKVFDGENIDDKVWQDMVDVINAKLAEMHLDPITLDFNTGNVKKETKEVNKEWNAAASAIQAVGNAMSQIEDPAAKVMGTIAQAVATMALSYAQAASATSYQGWGWVAFAATGLATMLSSISAIKQATSGFANGGVIPGNSMSGDNLRGMTPDGTVYGLDSQEIILNKAQQGNLASQLTDSAVQGFGGQPYVEGEKIFLGMNNSSRRMGRGEIVTTQTLRRMGLTR